MECYALSVWCFEGTIMQSAILLFVVFYVILHIVDVLLNTRPSGSVG